MEVFENLSVATQWALAGAFLLLFSAAGIAIEYRFRKRAISVRARVVKALEFHRHTSYYMRYELDGQIRNLYYRAPHLTPTLKDNVDYPMLIDRTAPPNVDVPQTDVLTAFGRGEPASASMASAPLVGGWTWAAMIAGIAMVALAAVSTST
ncbi:MAG: hypothetical protein K0U93_03600 [Gammaproteobacteria bacterium]|nr:hypothetical protein [Gammaproteobacteria bacterium]